MASAKTSKNSTALKPILVLNGPNLNLLGTREQHIYGKHTIVDIETMCKKQAAAHKLSIDFRQSNHEGEMVTIIQQAREANSAVIINPAAYSHTSIAIHDALKMLDVPVIEVHLSNLHKREEFRHHSYVSSVATGVIMGLGAQGYMRAIDAVAAIIPSA